MTEFSEYEFEILSDQKFLLTKSSVLAKVNDLLTVTRKEINKSLKDMVLPNKSLFKSGKISRGENYLGLPYLVLDFPAYFTNQDTFAFRTMFWWGHYFSVTLHLSGVSLERYRDKLLENFPQFLNQDIYICVANTPWHYHFEPDNYQLLREEHMQLIANAPFVKLTRKLELENWKALPGFAGHFFDVCVSILTS